MQKSVLNKAVIVGALGYFVDIYDLLLFSIVRVPSLRALQVPESQILDRGMWLLNVQMVGLLLGGLLWGIWGDKKGRLSVLFGSILLYSFANLANAFVHTLEWYSVLRFIAGVGLAGELGAAITLVSEVMSTEHRGYGTAVVAGVGLLGAVFAAIVGDLCDWRVAYAVGGGLGLLLLLLRVQMSESGMFASMKSQFHEQKHTMVRQGHFLALFAKPERALKYLACICIGIPIWYVIGVLMTFAPEIARALDVRGAISGGQSILFSYLGLSVGDLASGLTSQWLKSRKKSLLLYMLLTLALSLILLFSRSLSQPTFYGLCWALGFGAGYWAVFVTNASEQFGTNLRNTVATTVPNFVRGSVVLLTLAVKHLQNQNGLVTSVLVVGLGAFAIALAALWRLPESYGKDLVYVEKH